MDQNVDDRGRIPVNLVGRWQKGWKEPLWGVTNIEPEEALKIDELRMRIEQTFKDLKNLLGLEKGMSKTLKNLRKILSLLLLAYVAGLLAGGRLREAVRNPRRRPLGSGRFILRKANRPLRPAGRAQAQVLHERLQALVGSLSQLEERSPIRNTRAGSQSSRWLLRPSLDSSEVAPSRCSHTLLRIDIVLECSCASPIPSVSQPGPWLRAFQCRTQRAPTIASVEPPLP